MRIDAALLLMLFQRLAGHLVPGTVKVLCERGDPNNTQCQCLDRSIGPGIRSSSLLQGFQFVSKPCRSFGPGANRISRRTTTKGEVSLPCRIRSRDTAVSSSSSTKKGFNALPVIRPRDLARTLCDSMLAKKKFQCLAVHSVPGLLY